MVEVDRDVRCYVESIKVGFFMLEIIFICLGGMAFRKVHQKAYRNENNLKKYPFFCRFWVLYTVAAAAAVVVVDLKIGLENEWLICLKLKYIFEIDSICCLRSSFFSVAACKFAFTSITSYAHAACGEMILHTNSNKSHGSGTCIRHCMNYWNNKTANISCIFEWMTEKKTQSQLISCG